MWEICNFQLPLYCVLRLSCQFALIAGVCEGAPKGFSLNGIVEMPPQVSFAFQISRTVPSVSFETCT